MLKNRPTLLSAPKILIDFEFKFVTGIKREPDAGVAKSLFAHECTGALGLFVKGRVSRWMFHEFRYSKISNSWTPALRNSVGSLCLEISTNSVGKVVENPPRIR